MGIGTGATGRNLSVVVHEIAVDGLPDMGKLTGRVAFIFDGCIVSGWPLIPREMRREGTDVAAAISEHARQGDVLWEGNSDVANHLKFSGVTHWIEFPEPIWDIARSGTAKVDSAEPAPGFFVPGRFINPGR